MSPDMLKEAQHQSYALKTLQSTVIALEKELAEKKKDIAYLYAMHLTTEISADSLIVCVQSLEESAPQSSVVHNTLEDFIRTVS